MRTRKKIVLTLFALLIGSVSVFAQIGKCKGKYLGNITAGTVYSNYTSLWNQMTMENESKWQSVEGTKGVYNFTGSDRGFNWAKNNGGIFKYHTLMWGAQTPGWVSSASSATIQAAIEPYFKAVADHYNPMGGLKMIDVLNEPINTAVATNLKDALTALYKAQSANSGDLNNQYGWAIVCFQLARKYFPNAVLLINEYNVEMNWNNCRAGYISMTNAIKNAPNLTDGQKNLIDGVGLQAHGVENLTAANFKACIDEIWTKTGLPCHITEFDATANPNEAKQQQVYSTLIPVAWEHAHVAGITFWGYIQGATWIGGNNTTGPGGTDSGILYSSNYSTNPLGDRPAMTWLRQYFAGQPSLACCPAPAPFANCANGISPTVSITAPVATDAFLAPATITINATAADADGTVTKVEFYNGTTKLGEDASSPYSYTWTNVAKGSYTITAVATDNSNNVTTSAAVVVKVNVAQGPYNGTAWPIPGKIECENFDDGGNGNAYSDSSPGSETGVAFRTDEDVDIENCTDAGAGYNIGYGTAGEWLEYTVNVAAAGVYSLTFRVACNGDGRTISLASDGTTIANNIAIPNTAGWQAWVDVKTDVTLTAGQHVLRLTIGTTDYVNLNYMTFATTATAPPTVVTPVTYCQGATATALTATGTALKWYTVATGGTALASAPVPSTSTAGSTTYYVSQTLNSLESDRASIVVTVNATPAAPTVTTPVNYTVGDVATALTATGTALKWYSVATGGTALASAPVPSTTTAATTKYYVSQTTGTCESSRAEIIVVVSPAVIPTVSLKAGWNLIGCPIDGSTDIAKALSSVWSQVESVKNSDSYWHESNTIPGLNTLLQLNWGEGYLIKVKTNCELDWIVR